jgi:hypothetical protein
MGVRDGIGQQVLREEFTVAITLGDKSVDSACRHITPQNRVDDQILNLKANDIKSSNLA